MGVHHDRRDAKSLRVPFEAIVEIGGEVADAFEAQSMDVSLSGMHLRTAYLPPVGQALLCRFGSGAQDIAVEAEVVWRKEESRGGEFGIRFTNLDGASAAALLQMCGIGEDGEPEEQKKTDTEPGTRVRLHIDGLGSPMKARVRGSTDSELLVGSNLEFLRVGRSLELEDVDRGAKRPAHIDRVDIEMERDSRVPQLVVTLRYDDMDESSEGPTPSSGAKSSAPRRTAPPKSASAGSRWAGMRQRYEIVRGAVFHPIAGVARRAGAGMLQWSQRAKTTAGLLWGRAVEKSVGDRAARVRRTTSPPPTGALHASGKRVVRSPVGDFPGSQAAVEELNERDITTGASRLGKRVTVAAMGGSAGMLVLLVIMLVHHSRSAAGTTVTENLVVAGAANESPASGAAADAGMVELQAAANPQVPAGSTSGPVPVEMVDDKKAVASAEERTAIPSFGSGKLTHAVILQVQMDGPIAAMHGTRLGNGFTVTVPGRKTPDTGASLTRLDARLSAVRVSNRSKGSELVFEFRGEVPPYLVKVRGDKLQIALGHPSVNSHPVAARTSAKEHARPDDHHRAGADPSGRPRDVAAKTKKQP